MNFVKGSSRPDAARIFVIHFDFDFRTAQFADDAEKLFHRHGRGAGFFYLGFDGAGDRHVEIRRREFQAVFSARIRTLERIGSVVRVLTTFCTDCNPLMSWSLAMVRFMAALLKNFFSMKSYY